MKRRRRGRKSQRKRERQTLLAGLGIIGIVGIGGALVWLASERRAQMAAIDPDTFCHSTNMPAALLILVDASDRLDAVEAERARALLEREIARLPRHGRVDLYLANSADGELSEPEFRRCNPGPAGSALVSDAAGDARRFSEDYFGALDTAFAAALAIEPADTSPLLESIRSASTRSLARLPDGTPVRVVVVSDLLQHSDVLSHYRSREDFGVFQASPGWSRAIADLRGADVVLGYVTRADQRQLQGRAHLAWWEDYVRASGGRVEAVETF